MLKVDGARLYSTRGRDAYLARLDHPEIADQRLTLYQMLDVALDAQKQTRAQMHRLGEAYPEISVFQEMPGAGPIGAHLFDAFTGDVPSP